MWAVGTVKKEHTQTCLWILQRSSHTQKMWALLECLRFPPQVLQQKVIFNIFPPIILVQILVACVILLLFVSVLVFLLSVITIDSLFMIVMHVKVVFYD